MQKLVNALALTSFALNAAVIGVGLYAYGQRDKLAEAVRERVMKEVSEAIPGLVNGAVKGAMKNVELPKPQVNAPVKQTEVEVPPLF